MRESYSRQLNLIKSMREKSPARLRRIENTSLDPCYRRGVPKIKAPPLDLTTLTDKWRALLAHINDVTAEASKAITQSRIQREKLAEVRKSSASIRGQAAALRAGRSKSNAKKSR